MVITDLMLQTLPSDRIYEFNLNYILNEIKNFREFIDSKLDEYIATYLDKVKASVSLAYNETTQTLYLEVKTIE